MVNEINGNKLTLVKPAAAQTNVASPAGGGVAAAPPATTVVSLTDLSARLQALTEMVADLPVVDQQKVDDFRQSLANGSYQVDPQGVVDKFLQLERMLAS